MTAIFRKNIVCMGCFKGYIIQNQKCKLLFIHIYVNIRWLIYQPLSIWSQKVVTIPHSFSQKMNVTTIFNDKVCNVIVTYNINNLYYENLYHL